MEASTFCARIIAENKVKAWHKLRRELALFDLDTLRSTLASCSLTLPENRPWLLFSEKDVTTIRKRADETIRKKIQLECEELIKPAPDKVNSRNVIYLARPARIVAGSFLVLQDERYAEWARRRIEALLELNDWMGDVHKKLCKRCDHIMANTAAELVCAHDWMGDAVDDVFTEKLFDGIRRLHMEPYLLSARSKDDFWSQDRYLANWKIMTHGESGLTICAFADRWPEAREALTLAADGVLEILDAVPPEGDWPEGVGYWYAVLFMGLRFSLALRRLTSGAVDLFQHPRLDVTGDFGASLISPAGKVYNYGDNPDVLPPGCAEAMLILGAENKRADWMTAARNFPSYSPLWLHLDNPEIKDKHPNDGTHYFTSSGVGILRKGSTFIGMRSGDSTVGHAHLDSNSFVVENRGVSLFRDSGNWPYAHFLGFFNHGHRYDGLRWNFDGPGTIGHNAILVDGQGQAYGAEYSGFLEKPILGEKWMCLSGNASKCYPGFLRKWRRSLLLIGDDLLIIRDIIMCEGKHHVEWLLHSDAEFQDDSDDILLVKNDVCARLIPLLPDRTNGWRVSDVTRHTTYENSNTGEIKRPVIRYRSFSPLQSAEFFEFLFLLQLGNSLPKNDTFKQEGESWCIILPDAGFAVYPEADTLTARKLKNQ